MKSATQTEVEAAAWLAKRDSDGWNRRDEEALGNWIAASTAHRIAYMRLESVWTKADRLRAFGVSGGVSDEIEAEAASAETFKGLKRVHWLSGALATAAAALVVLWLQIGTGPEYATPVGGFQRVPLTDGSQIELNTNTEVDIAYSDEARRIMLDQGEAFFEVAKDNKRPFIVEAGRYRVIAVGTAFSVRIAGDEVDVLVTEGRVRIERETVAPGTEKQVLVSAGQLADLQTNVRVVTDVAQAEYEHRLGWRQGVLVFDNQTLSEVAAEFNRYNRQQLVVLDPEVGAVTVGGTFRPTNLSGLIRLLEAGFGIEAVPTDDNRIVLRLAE